MGALADIRSQFDIFAGCERFAERPVMFLRVGERHAVQFGVNRWPFVFVGANDNTGGAAADSFHVLFLLCEAGQIGSVRK